MVKKINEKGSSIVMAIIVIMIFLIITGTCLTIASNYQKRSVMEHARKQAYLNAVAVADAIGGELNINEASILPPNSTQAKLIESVTLPISLTDKDGKEHTSSSGNVTGKIYYEDETKKILNIEVISSYAGQKETLILKVKKNGDTWCKVEYIQNGQVK